MCWVTKNKTKSSYSDHADDFLSSLSQTEAQKSDTGAQDSGCREGPEEKTAGRK